MKYGLSEKQLEQVISILKKYDEIEGAILFGSRALGNYKPASDVDIAIKGDKADALLSQKLIVEGDLIKSNPSIKDDSMITQELLQLIFSKQYKHLQEQVNDYSLLLKRKISLYTKILHIRRPS